MPDCCSHQLSRASAHSHSLQTAVIRSQAATCLAKSIAVLGKSTHREATVSEGLLVPEVLALTLPSLHALHWDLEHSMGSPPLQGMALSLHP